MEIDDDDHPNYPEVRFVRQRLATEDDRVATLTFLAPRTRDGMDSSQHPIVRHLTETDPGKAEAVAATLSHLLAVEGEMFDWLEADPANSAAFAADPISTLRREFPEIPLKFD